MFKGPNQDIDAIYTAPSSAVCGVTLETSGKEYLVTGICFLKYNKCYVLVLLHISFHVISLHLMRSPSTTGKLETDGTMHVTLCDFIEPWEATSATQKKGLTQRYEMGCDCKVNLQDIQ